MFHSHAHVWSHGFPYIGNLSPVEMKDRYIKTNTDLWKKSMPIYGKTRSPSTQRECIKKSPHRDGQCRLLMGSSVYDAASGSFDDKLRTLLRHDPE